MPPSSSPSAPSATALEVADPLLPAAVALRPLHPHHGRRLRPARLPLRRALAHPRRARRARAEAETRETAAAHGGLTPMATSTAELGSSPAWLATLRARLTPARAREAATNGRVYALLAAARARARRALAAVSLARRRTTRGRGSSGAARSSTSTCRRPAARRGSRCRSSSRRVFSLFGEAAPDLWLVVARGGALLAVMLAFRLAWRLTGGRGVAGVDGRRRRRGRAVISSQFVRTMALGNSEGLMVAFTLWGIERHLDGSYRQAFVLGFLASLLRPEIWPFLGVYGLWLRADRPQRAVAGRLGCGVLIARAVVPAGVLGLGQLHARRRPRAAAEPEQPGVRRRTRSRR